MTKRRSDKERGFVYLPPSGYVSREGDTRVRHSPSVGAQQAVTEARVRANAQPVHVFKCLACREGLASLEHDAQDGLRLVVWSPVRFDGPNRIIRTGRPIAVPMYFEIGPKWRKASEIIEVVCRCGETRKFPVSGLRKLLRLAMIRSTSS